MKLNQIVWFVVLWLGGVLTLAIVAVFFRMLIQWAY